MQNTNISIYPILVYFVPGGCLVLDDKLVLAGTFWLFHLLVLVLISHMELMLASVDFSTRRFFMFLPGLVVGLLQPNICEGGT